MKSFIKTLVISLQAIAVCAVLSIVYGFIVQEGFTLRFMFYACFMVGAIIICISLVLLFLSAFNFKMDELSDHTTLAGRYMEQKEQKRAKAFEFLFMGIMMIVITGLIQLLLAVLI